MLTNEQLHAIREIIRRHHTAVIAGVFGPELLTAEERLELESAGMMEPEIRAIEDAYVFGQAVAEEPDVESWSHGETSRWLASNPIPLTEAEERAAEIAAHGAADSVRNLGGNMAADVGRVLTEAEERAAVRSTVESSIERRQTIAGLKSELGNMTGDWSRDWHRVAATEIQDAHLKGRADGYESRFGDPLVYKIPQPGACPACREFHVGPDGRPRVFRLSVLRAHGSNVGRRQRDWLPVVGTVHPHCQCPMVRVPDGWGFGEGGDLIPGGELGEIVESTDDFERSMSAADDLRKAQRNISKATVTHQFVIARDASVTDGSGGVEYLHGAKMPSAPTDVDRAKEYLPERERRIITDKTVWEFDPGETPVHDLKEMELEETDKEAMAQRKKRVREKEDENRRVRLVLPLVPRTRE